MCYDHRECSWTLGQLTTSSTLSRRLGGVFGAYHWLLLMYFPLRGWLSDAAMFLAPVYWLHVAHFLSDLHANLYFHAGKIDFPLSVLVVVSACFSPVKLPCNSVSVIQRSSSDSQGVWPPVSPEQVNLF